MSKVPVDRSSFDEILGLTCIENYVLAVLAKCLNHTYLYYDSFVEVADVIEEIFGKKVGFAFFRIIPRVHKSAMADGIISYQSVDLDSICDAIDFVSYCCLEVKPDWFSSRYGTTAWRDDHYIMIEKRTGREYYFINDNPRDDGVMDEDEVVTLFAGSLFLFRVEDASIDCRREVFLDRMKNKLNSAVLGRDVLDLCHGHTLAQLRDFLGVLKISRKRMEAFIRNYISTEFMKEYIRELEKHFVGIEYMRLRNNSDDYAKMKILRDILSKDTEMIKLLRQSLGGL